MDLSKLKGTFGFTAKESMKFEKSYQSWHQTFGPGVLPIPLLIATKLSMTKSERIWENFLKIYRRPWKLPANQNQPCGQSGQYGWW